MSSKTPNIPNLILETTQCSQSNLKITPSTTTSYGIVNAKFITRGLKRKFQRLDELGHEQLEKMARITIEESMSRAVVRKCWLCGRRYVKEGGCNAVRCVCGALSCYHCGQLIVNNYATTHAGCPPLTEVAEDEGAVRQAARAARQELLAAHPTLTFKYDPSRS